MPFQRKYPQTMLRVMMRKAAEKHSAEARHQFAAEAKAIHVILDNYGIHDSKLVAWALLEARGRIRLVPLPPYCPQHNRIERVWEDLHAEATRNHTCPDMESLMIEVRMHLLRRYFRILDERTEETPLAQAS